LEYLDRAILFGNWHMEYGMYNGWPLHGIIMDGQFTDRYVKGSFQSGTGLFYYDLFMQTGNSQYIDKGMRPIAENYRDYFFNEDGSLIMQRDIFSNKVVIDERPSAVEHNIHHFNDDFGNSMLQAAAVLFDDESYRRAAYSFAKWLAANQNEDGGFNNSTEEVYSAVPMVMMYFDELGRFYDDKVLLDARDKALNKLLSSQFDNTGDKRLDGGFKGRLEGVSDSTGERCVNMRTSMYALIALLKLESELEDIWLGSHNRPFIDPLRKLKDTPYIFKW
jgi:hypothetical protein